MSEPSLPDKVVALDRALDVGAIAHAFGGAIALAYYAEPRATIDVDLNVFVSIERHEEVTVALTPLGVSAQLHPDDVERDGQARCWWGRTPVDLFFSYHPFHDAMRGATRTMPFGDHAIPVLGPEHLVVCKVVFDRDKDWLDIAQVAAAVQGFDLREVRRWLDDLLPAGDARRTRFEGLADTLFG